MNDAVGGPGVAPAAQRRRRSERRDDAWRNAVAARGARWKTGRGDRASALAAAILHDGESLDLATVLREVAEGSA